MSRYGRKKLKCQPSGEGDTLSLPAMFFQARGSKISLKKVLKYPETKNKFKIFFDPHPNLPPWGGVPCSKKKGKMGIPSYYHNHHIPSTTIIIENKCSAFCNPWTIKDCMQPSSTITYHHIPSHTITYLHILLYTITYHHIPS